MKLYQLKHDDLIKIIPFVDKMGNISYSKTFWGINYYLTKLKFYDEYNSLIELFQLIKKIERETKLNNILNE